MDDDATDSGPAAMARRLCRATNDRDLRELVACFAPGYRNLTPAHPRRGFTGREQVRRNWEQIFAAIPDLSTELLGSVVDGDTVWTEWEHRGTRPDGTRHLMRGVVIFRRGRRRRRLGPLHLGRSPMTAGRYRRGTRSGRVGRVHDDPCW
jgi:ketosteroid isomerase-like protein